MRRSLPLLAICATLLTNPSFAQDMRPLSEVAQDSARGYPSVRCGGLYQALMEWTGAARMGEDTFADYNDALTNLLTAAILIYVSEGVGGVEHVSSIVARDARNIADLYLARFEANYAREGHAFGEDELAKSDIIFCLGVSNRSRELIEAAGQQ